MYCQGGIGLRTCTILLYAKNQQLQGVYKVLGDGSKTGSFAGSNTVSCDVSNTVACYGSNTVACDGSNTVTCVGRIPLLVTGQTRVNYRYLCRSDTVACDGPNTVTCDGSNTDTCVGRIPLLVTGQILLIGTGQIPLLVTGPTPLPWSTCEAPNPIGLRSVSEDVRSRCTVICHESRARAYR